MKPTPDPYIFFTSPTQKIPTITTLPATRAAMEQEQGGEPGVIPRPWWKFWKRKSNPGS